MGRRRSCKNEINKGTWSKEEDETLFSYVTLHGEGKWREVAQYSGLKRCAKSCRYRYLNYLKPGLKRGDISEYEQDLIIKLHRQLGNRWALIAKKLPGRTDIEIKNYWKIFLSKKLSHQEKKNKVMEDIQTEEDDDDGNVTNVDVVDDDDGDVIDDFLLSDMDQNVEMVNFVNDLNYINNNNNNNNIQQIEVKKQEDVEKVGRHELKGAWSRNEDEILLNYVALHGEGQWKKVPQRTGLKRCGKSCRHRYLHYLKPGIKRGNITKEEEDMIIRLHRLHGNRWTLIAKKLPGRTDSEIKNHWHAYLSKKAQALVPQSSEEQVMNCVYSPSEAGSPPNAKMMEEEDDPMMMMRFCDESNHQNTNTISCPAPFEIEYDDAFLDDFLLNIFQNDQIGEDDCVNSKIPIAKMADHNMVASSIDHHQCDQLPGDILDFWSSSEFPFFD